jgi:hypothetical protein
VAQRQERPVETFSEWLRAICGRADISTPSDLYRLFVKAAGDRGQYRDKATINRWWNGGDPRHMEDVRVLLQVLDRAIPNEDAYESFVGFLRFRRAPRRGRGSHSAPDAPLMVAVR